jgi:chromosome segregation ATPase
LRLDPRGTPEGQKLAYIREIQLKGFKSFGTSKLSIPLARGLNVIIGRNGSGKSNITDAIIFAFGGRSTTMMRAERFQDFLYMKGGRTIAPYAEVTLLIDNSDGVLPVMSKTIEISRRVDRTGKCVYRINDRRADRQEVVDLLSPVMGSPDGVNFILQDQVKRIFSVTPEERRGIIEDLAGVREYNERREKAEKDLSGVETNLKIIDGRLQDLRLRVERLRKQVQDYMAVKTIDRELQQIRAAILFRRLREREAELKRLESLERSKSSKESAMNQQIQSIAKRISKLEEERKKIMATQSRIRSEGVFAEFGRLESQISEQRRMLEELARRRAETEAELRRTRQELDRGRALVVSKIEEFRQMHGRFRQLLSELSGSRDPAEQRRLLGEISDLLARIDGSLDSVIAEISSAAQQSLEPARKVLTLEGRISAYIEQESGLAHELEKNVKKLEALKPEKSRAEERLRRLDSRLDEIDARIGKLNERKDRLTERLLRISEARAQGEGKKASLVDEIARLRQDLEMIKVDYRHLCAKKMETLQGMEKELEGRKAEIGEVNPRAPDELRQEEEKLRADEERYRKLEEERQQLLSFMAELDQKKRDAFFKVFNVVSEAFTEIFREISGGAEGKLVITNMENPLEGGLDFEVDFGEKTHLLSGGQKTLTAVAFILALQRCRPSTFYVLDEIDESLDPFNRQRVAQLLKKFSKESQMIVVTLHTSMAEVADRIFGVVKENGVSRVFSADLSAIEEVGEA